ncbi:NADH-quinone oxidoreductase subunit C [Streptomyces sp. SP17BM10]|uniref:NADH-quinone oxidoreductase subunit C n=1 Tax=Streptomyces sp. SP17BM10 TaxID=3002530 RepID=UPI002E7902B5|nr:NADH-quinone oxidoreductase subunit C [Streptomyces sp. SP17BM10]MEE1787202.1 NADH-quinone oxidoreductase subunit C [Streptomyces sp. SP17BM10]
MTTAEQYAASVGQWATGAEAYGLITVDVPAEHWIEALTAARDGLGLGFFDWLSAVDELADGFSVVAHLASAEGHAVRHLALRTRVPRDKAALPTAVPVYAGAAWHERETHEMFGIDFPGHPHLVTLLLPDGFEGHPLRKEFVLAARVAKAWPGAKEPGESDHGDGPARRKMQPAGVPDPNEWGPLKGTLPPVAERPARGARAAGAAARTPRAAAAGAAGAAGEAPAVRADRPRRTRSVSDGSASQAGAEAAVTGEAPAIRADRPRRTRSVSDGSVSQPAEEPKATDAPKTAEEPKAERPAPARTRSSDAPWHNPVPAHDAKPAEESVAEPTEAPAETPAEKAEKKDDPSARPAGQDGDGT